MLYQKIAPTTTPGPGLWKSIDVNHAVTNNAAVPKAKIQ